jgi:ParB family chromosome partitioning protein
MTATATTSIVPLSDLRLDEKANVRHANRGVDPVLLASIKAHGLRQPLIVRKNGKGYVVVDGGQRLAVLQEIAKLGGGNTHATVIIADDDMTDAGAREVSLALNIARTAMHPVDEYRAFALLHTDKEKPLDVASIATRFGISEKIVAQRLALGALDESVLKAWQDGEIKEEVARAFTLASSKKQQAQVLAEVLKGNYFPNPYNIRRALKIGDDNMGKYLDLVGIEAYEARGGKVHRDLFGSDHQVDKPELVKAMVDELLTATMSKLVADGWAWARLAPDVQDNWRYPRVPVASTPTKAETKRLKELQAICEDENLEQDVIDKASDEYDALEAEIKLRSYTAKQKAGAGCFVDIEGTSLSIEYGRIEPKEDAKTATAKKVATEKKKARKPEDAIPDNLIVRLSEQTTAAVQATLHHDQRVALAALIAGITSGEQCVGIASTRHNFRSNRPSFAAAFDAAMKLATAKQIETLAKIVADAVNLKTFKAPTLDHAGHRRLCEAINSKAFHAALREKFDAKDYFTSASRSTIVAAVTEAMGKDHGSKIAKMDKGAAVKFAVANLPKLKWLPKQMRVASYDGPKAKR